MSKNIQMIDTFIILAGGRGSRIGEDKPFLNLQNKSLIQILINKIIDVCNHIIIVSNNPDSYSSFPGEYDNKIHIVKDIEPDKGVLMGLYTGLMHSETLYNFVISCDIPFFKPELAQYFWELKEGYDIVIPKICNRSEPLHAVYSRNCIEHIERSLSQNLKRLICFHEYVKVRHVEQIEFDHLDPDLISFFNINTPSDYQKAKMLIENR